MFRVLLIAMLVLALSIVGFALADGDSLSDGNIFQCAVATDAFGSAESLIVEWRGVVLLPRRGHDAAAFSNVAGNEAVLMLTPGLPDGESVQLISEATGAAITVEIVNFDGNTGCLLE